MSQKNQTVPWMGSLAGAIANIASISLHPLENVKLRFQASDMAANNPIPPYKSILDALRQMYKHEGMAALYRGSMVNSFATSVAQSIFFYVYNDGKNRYAFDADRPNSWNTAWISLRAGIISMWITTPMWVVKTRLALLRQQQLGPQQGSVLLRLVKDMMFNEGPKSFFRGFTPSLFMSSYGMIQMYTYENVNFLFGFKSGQKMTRENFFIPFFTGGLSKCVASAVLMPVNVVRLRLQMKKYSTQQVEDMGLKIQSNTRQEVTYDGIYDCVRKIKCNEGFRGFYKGLTPNLLRIFPTSGIFFIVYEYTLLALQKHYKE